jgi:hypothetical protein
MLCDGSDRTVLEVTHLQHQSLIIGQPSQRRRDLEKLLTPQDVLAG